MNGDNENAGNAQGSGTNTGIGGGTGGSEGIPNGTASEAEPATGKPGRTRRRRTAGTGTGTGTGNDGNSTGSTSDGTGEQTEVPSIQVEAVEFGAPTVRRTRRSKTVEVSIKPDELAEVVAGTVYMIGQTRELHLRAAYNVRPEHCIKIAEPLSRILSRLPEKYLDIANNAIDPIAMVLACYGLYTAINHAEGILNAQYSAMVAAQRPYAETAERNGTGEPVADEAVNFESDERGGFGTDAAI